MPKEPLLTTRQAAAYLACQPNTLEQWRSQGKGPRFRRLPSKQIRYAQEDLDEWAGVPRGRRPGTLSVVRGGT
jgi:hypothetical protein